MTNPPKKPAADLAELFKIKVRDQQNIFNKLASTNRVASVNKPLIAGKRLSGVLLPSTSLPKYSGAVFTSLIIDQSGSMGAGQAVDLNALRRTNLEISVLVGARRDFDKTLDAILAEGDISMEKVLGPDADSLLRTANAQPDVYYLSRLLAAGANPNCTSKDGTTLLLQAINNNYAAHVKELLRCGATRLEGEKEIENMVYLTNHGRFDMLNAIFDTENTITRENAHVLRQMFSTEERAATLTSSSDSEERERAAQSLRCCRFIEERVIAWQQQDIDKRIEAANKNQRSVLLPRMRR